jgi:hypothetical protein
MRCQRKTSKPRIKHHSKIKYQVAKGEKNHLTYSTSTKDIGCYMFAWVHMQDIIYEAKVTIVVVPTSAYIYVSINIMR